ncbi:MAG: hypothetical protein HKO59_11440, partial [Phycisphaerales bacterium]|nr:hypothetical protein [Phycisphaerales bacterium]
MTPARHAVMIVVVLVAALVAGVVSYRHTAKQTHAAAEAIGLVRDAAGAWVNPPDPGADAAGVWFTDVASEAGLDVTY